MTHFIEAQTKYLSSKGYTVILGVTSYEDDSDGYSRVRFPKVMNIAYRDILPTSFDHNYLLDFELDNVFQEEFIKEMLDESK